MTTTNLLAALASLVILTATNQIIAAEPSQQQGKITDPAIFAQVDGLNLSRDMFEFLLQSRETDNSDGEGMAVAEPPNRPSLQDKTARDLIMTTLLAQ